MWSYQDKEFTQEDVGDYVGFVYLIEYRNRKYVGKKGFVFSKTKRSVRRKNKKHYKVVSDWEVYNGSNKELLDDIDKYGTKGLKKIILYLCKSKGEMSYWETYEILTRHALLDSVYYNTWLSAKIRREHVKGIRN